MEKLKGKQRQRVKKWIEKLRSGDYKQGKGALRPEDNKFCCLGVACDYYAKSNRIKQAWGDEILEYDDGLPFYDETGSKMSGGMSEHIMDWFGIDDEYAETLVEMNDEQGASFKKIASKIEKDLL